MPMIQALQAQVQTLTSASQGAAGVQSDLLAQTIPTSQTQAQATAAAQVAQPAQSTSWPLPAYWTEQLLNLGGGAPFLPQDDTTDWNPYFDNPTVPMLNVKRATTAGELDYDGFGVDCERRFTLVFNSNATCTIAGYLSIFHVDQVARAKCQINGGGFQGGTFTPFDGVNTNQVVGFQVSIPIRQGQNVLNIILDYYTQDFYFGIDLSSFCTFVGGS